LETSLASAQSVPVVPAFMKVMLTLMATATLPYEFGAAAKAKALAAGESLNSYCVKALVKA
jgi:hypothetical protein